MQYSFDSMSTMSFPSQRPLTTKPSLSPPLPQHNTHHNTHHSRDLSYPPHTAHRELSTPSHNSASPPLPVSHRHTTLSHNTNRPCWSPHSQPHEIFVGNLSFFCREDDLFALFSQYGTVTNVRITRNGQTQRSLLFGFVAFSDSTTAREMAKLFRGHLFLGRRMRVELSEDAKTRREDPQGFRVHFSLAAVCPADSVVLPTEMLLRKYFLRFGFVVDVSVKEHSLISLPHNAHSHSTHLCRQEGYGFVSFESAQAAQCAVSHGESCVEGITVMCTMPHTHSQAWSPALSNAHIHTQSAQSYSQTQANFYTPATYTLTQSNLPLSRRDVLSQNAYTQHLQNPLAQHMQSFSYPRAANNSVSQHFYSGDVHDSRSRSPSQTTWETTSSLSNSPFISPRNTVCEEKSNVACWERECMSTVKHLLSDDF